MKPSLTLHLLEDKGDDSRWSIGNWGPVVYLTCGKAIADKILASLTKFDDGNQSEIKTVINQLSLIRDSIYYGTDTRGLLSIESARAFAVKALRERSNP